MSYVSEFDEGLPQEPVASEPSQANNRTSLSWSKTGRKTVYTECKSEEEQLVRSEDALLPVGKKTGSHVLWG